MARRRSGIPRLSFSWNRALGVTSAKRKFARMTGIPTTRSGRQRKAARMMGCAVYLGLMVVTILGLAMLSVFTLLL